MGEIDIGPGATNRGTNRSALVTFVDLNNPANDTGVINSVEVWGYNNITGFKIGTFSGSGTSYNDRDYATIGSVTGGSKQTFTGLSIDVVTSDFLGCYFSDGAIERDSSGYLGVYTYSGDAFGSSSHTYTILDGDAISIYGTGATSTATISPSGIASTLAFGTAKLNQNILPSGIASTLAFGTAKLNQNILPSGIASISGVGSPTITAIIHGVIQPSGIAPTTAFGTPIISVAGLHIPPQSRYLVELHTPISQGWRIPSSHNDPSSAWEGETKAYDGSLVSGQAYTLTTNAKLELIPDSPLYTSKLRIYGGATNNGTPYNPNIVLDVYYSSAWHNVYTGGIQYDAWVEKSLASPQTIEKARVSCTDTLSASYPIKNFYVTEFWFYAAPSGGELLSILENAHSIAIEQSLNKSPVISLSLPAGDDKSVLLTRANEVWIRDIVTGDVIASGILDERVDTR
ncbi:hypothetical protein B1778_04370 [Dehalococcoides mccartyi]|uniref:hypothetical protein n=1 Tax=Dehalococcoides mccartyi TaxID=61435 RepID=UPI0002B75DC8|nr:hypothetical protein [Dehalococcoides mccartyi]AGG07987.1 hypothetical protein btf_900 [Dehalococcoides mccartyi BTF08]AQU05970.1 hypothetical protein B1777_04555 [Dehalococcoides mccartyi]AQU07415.1 hypothetical protein B1778_04370 [Dehalococcoides mccartyi]AQW62518.1 hypothetical protein B1779_04375 [Dehalococcoides mccartyi]